MTGGAKKATRGLILKGHPEGWHMAPHRCPPTLTPVLKGKRKKKDIQLSRSTHFYKNVFYFKTSL